MIATKMISKRALNTTLLNTLTRQYSTKSQKPEFKQKILRPNQLDATERRPFDQQQPRPSKGTLSDYDIYDDLAPPLNNIEGIYENGFELASGAKVISKSNDHPHGLVLLGSESFQVDLTKGIEGLDKGILEFDQSVLGIFDVVLPKPELLVVGLGAKSRILGPKTTKYFHSLGISTHLSNTINGCSNFDLLATERPGQVAAFLLPPNI